MHDKLTRLVGKRCLVNCTIEKRPTQVLWDTGAQVSIMSRRWLRDNLPNVPLLDMEPLMTPDLQLTAANGTSVPYDGWVALDVKFPNQHTTMTHVLTVPFLVTTNKLTEPIIGYNVIEEVVQHAHETDLHQLLISTIPNMKKNNVEAMVDLIRNNNSDDFGPVKTGRSPITIPKKMTVDVKCRVRLGPLRENLITLFEPAELGDLTDGLLVEEGILELQRGSSSCIKIPVRNQTNKDIDLAPRTLIGNLQLVRSVCSSCLASPSDKNTGHKATINATQAGEQTNQTSNPSSTKPWDPPFEFPNLTQSQKEVVLQMLREESASFAKDETDIGSIPELEMKIRLTDNIPVQRTYQSIPRPLYQEVKVYLHDLMEREWIIKSYSPYAYPVVCARSVVVSGCVWISEN